MTELVINDKRVDRMTIPVESGQIRANDIGELVLISRVNSSQFHAVVLRSSRYTVFETFDFEPKSVVKIRSLFPHVIDNVKITVELNARERI